MMKFSLLAVVLVTFYISSGYCGSAEEENKDILALIDVDLAESNDVLLVRDVREAKKDGGKKNKTKRGGRKNRKGRKKSRQGKKSNKKSTKGKGKKRNGKGKKRNGKGKKKNGKGKKKNGKGRKRNGKGKKKNGKEKKSNRKETRQTGVSATCVSDLADLGAFYGNQARNFFRQASRAVTKSNQINGKKTKNTDFEEPLKIVNSSSSGCSGNSTVTGVITTLGNCSTSINSECGGALNSTAKAEAEKCKTSAEAYRTAFIKAAGGKPAPEKICGELAALKTLKASAIADCKNVQSLEKDMTNAKKACDKSFQDCRKAERETIGILNTCAPSCVTTASSPGQTTSAFMNSMGRYYF